MGGVRSVMVRPIVGFESYVGGRLLLDVPIGEFAPAKAEEERIACECHPLKQHHRSLATGG